MLFVRSFTQSCFVCLFTLLVYYALRLLGIIEPDRETAEGYIYGSLIGLLLVWPIFSLLEYLHPTD